MHSSEQKAPLISARGLVKYYGETVVVNGVDLVVYPGECFGLLGPNGAGKTTTLRMLMGGIMPTGGELTVLGYDIPAEARAMRAKVGLVPQHDNLDPDFTVRENLLCYARYFGISDKTMAGRIDDLLAYANLTHKANARIPELSGGMQRRLTLARALVNQPELVVLDEPTTGLDPQARHVIWQRLRSLLARGTTLLLTTHYMEEAQRLCDRIAIMDAGRILAVDSPRALIARHIEPVVVEVRGDGAHAWAQGLPNGLGRIEEVGETVFCYLQDDHFVRDTLRQRMELEYLSRPANLEDVFLKLTGRDLRDA
ncbi:MAG: ATP-binding cassette domain-containing protein [Pseudomonadota bacterium]